MIKKMKNEFPENFDKYKNVFIRQYEEKIHIKELTLDGYTLFPIKLY